MPDKVGRYARALDMQVVKSHLLEVAMSRDMDFTDDGDSVTLTFGNLYQPYEAKKEKHDNGNSDKQHRKDRIKSSSRVKPVAS